MGRDTHADIHIAAHARHVFDEAQRAPHHPDIEARLLPYLGGIARQIGGKLLVSNTVADHVHLLVDLPPTITMSEVVRKLKASSSKWIHDVFPERQSFAWQRGFGAFSVSRSNVPAVARYIKAQKEHHRKVTFQTELVALLRRHAIDFDDRYLWD
jgi:putative transposase